MPEELDKNILDTLSAEERAAIEESEHTEEEVKTLQAIAGQDEEGDDDDSDDDDPAAGDKAKPPVEGESAADAAAGAAEKDGVNDKGAGAEAGSTAAAPAAGDAEEDAEDDGSFAPRYHVALPEDFAAQVKAVNDESMALAQKFKDGEIEFPEYQTESAKLNERRDALASLRTKAEMAEEMNTQTAEQAWDRAQNRFAASIKKTEGIDYRTDEAKASDLNTFVKALASDPKHVNRSYEWFLTEAHKRVKALHGIVTEQNAAGSEKPAARKPPVDKVPANLSQVPGGDGPGDVGGEFANLDGLDGLELEDAIAKMTPAQRERWKTAA